VSHGNHAWVLTGFTATADPAATSRFAVTSVRVVGPLWGLQSRSYGYDMRPDTKLTPAQLKGFFTPWHYAGIRMAWEGQWVSVQPVAKAARIAPATPNPTARPTARPTPRPTPRTTPSPTATPVASPAAFVAATPSPSAVDELAGVAGPVSSAEPVAEAAVTAPSAPAGDGLPTAVLAGVALVLVTFSVVAAGGARRFRTRR
jgi:hypothetical protein